MTGQKKKKTFSPQPPKKALGLNDRASLAIVCHREQKIAACRGAGV